MIESNALVACFVDARCFAARSFHNAASCRLQEYIRQNPIPLDGNWDAVSGEEFLRKLLTEGVDATTYKGGVRDPLFSCVGTIGVDPRAIGQRIMDIRSALAKEFIQVSLLL